MPAKIFSISIIGLNTELIEVEADISGGLSSFSIVGLADASIREAKERVRSAIKNSGLNYPIQKKIINLAPAEIKKQGSLFDLPIAVSLLCASKQIPLEVFDESIVIGELSLDGNLKEVRGVLPIVSFAKKKGFKRIFLPAQNKFEARIIEGIKIYAVSSLQELKNFCQGKEDLEAEKGGGIKLLDSSEESETDQVCFAGIYGLEAAKRALTIGAAGFHNILLKGRPGGGKTVLARAFRSIMPPLNMDEALEVAKIYSVVEGLKNQNRITTERPFRELHHTASKIAVSGGGAILKPGEITLAHKGVLFMDEINEFQRETLEVLRQPLEDGYINLSRLKYSVKFPCDFTLLAAMNNCPCGNKECKCTQRQIKLYQNRISGPILDRIDIFLEIPRISIKTFWDEKEKKDEESIKEKIKEANEIQLNRNKKPNSKLTSDEVKKTCAISAKAKSMLEKAASKFDLSNRGYLKTIKVAQTIADLEKKGEIGEDEILEALQYRLKSNFIAND